MTVFQSIHYWQEYHKLRSKNPLKNYQSVFSKFPAIKEE